ncbi:hypothetical protein [Halalkalicoccus salilacus]|uniref:hypothetical protein n=1 Tax=Halalkalicoccus sp. GCM10025704 TaxID=3252662 RepID=UPI00361821A0
MTIGVLVGSAVGIAAASVLGPDGWVLGGGTTGVVVGRASPDLAAALFHGAAAGGIAGVVFAVVFGLGTGVRLALAAGDPALLAWGLSPFLVVIIVYGVGCAVFASVFGGSSTASEPVRSERVRNSPTAVASTPEPVLGELAGETDFPRAVCVDV